MYRPNLKTERGESDRVQFNSKFDRKGQGASGPRFVKLQVTAGDTISGADSTFPRYMRTPLSPSQAWAPHFIFMVFGVTEQSWWCIRRVITGRLPSSSLASTRFRSVGTRVKYNSFASVVPGHFKSVTVKVSEELAKKLVQFGSHLVMVSFLCPINEGKYFLADGTQIPGVHKNRDSSVSTKQEAYSGLTKRASFMQGKTPKTNDSRIKWSHFERWLGNCGSIMGSESCCHFPTNSLSQLCSELSGLYLRRMFLERYAHMEREKITTSGSLSGRDEGYQIWWKALVISGGAECAPVPWTVANGVLSGVGFWRLAPYEYLGWDAVDKHLKLAFIAHYRLLEQPGYSSQYHVQQSNEHGNGEDNGDGVRDSEEEYDETDKNRNTEMWSGNGISPIACNNLYFWLLMNKQDRTRWSSVNSANV
ncbi:hypothetical protein BGY98DRAFT_1176264 [Russula aff. rugulosa BPL654]|nr:hypothetical protein BGY98DRAFT_1176264 [Russula aff. rugulosa BPL654]